MYGEIRRGEAACPRCAHGLFLAGGPTIANTAPSACAVCGSEFLYWQKDFNQKAGCALVALGAALVPWTYGLSLAVMALVDFVLYQLLPRVSVCYVCKARYRGVPPHPDHRPFDLQTAQTYEARSAHWAEGKLGPG
jgi:hypothetical protein